MSLVPGLSTAESQILQLLRAGVSVQRAVAIGAYRATWTEGDVWAMAGIVPEPEPEPEPEFDTSYCGTTRGYHRHRRNDEDPCPACKQAKADYAREWRRGRVS